MYLSDWYDTSIDWSYPPNPSPWDVQEKKQFEDAVQEFLIDVRQALFPDFEVKDEHRPVSWEMYFGAPTGYECSKEVKCKKKARNAISRFCRLWTEANSVKGICYLKLIKNKF